MNETELSELIQDDILTRFDYLDEGEKELLCQIVVDKIKEYKTNKSIETRD